MVKLTMNVVDAATKFLVFINQIGIFISVAEKKLVKSKNKSIK